ncbi:chemotaxis protein CheX [Reichenbachiella sp.]|uniref:chemotaxis protein CheX n=1 Tax=Reichenbachiella sp. TaxID=2184521 RepID=UPI003299C90D
MATLADNKKEEFENTCQVFIDSVNNYFEHLTDIKSKTGVPYLKDSEDMILKDFTGMIGISGSKTGFVYISGDKKMYDLLVNIFLDIEKPSNEDILDMAGELSNVVAGNVREKYGNNFMISVPIVFQGSPEKIKFPKDVPAYVIPIEWCNYKASVVIGIK